MVLAWPPRLTIHDKEREMGWVLGPMLNRLSGDLAPGLRADRLPGVRVRVVVGKERRRDREPQPMAGPDDVCDIRQLDLDHSDDAGRQRGRLGQRRTEGRPLDPEGQEDRAA